MRHLDFTTCLSDPYVLMRPIKKSGGLLCFECIILYIDNNMVVGESADNIIMNDMGRYFELKSPHILRRPSS